MNNKIRLYIASPYTLGDVAINVKDQIDAAARLIDAGFAPFVPLYYHFQHMHHPRPPEVWVELDNHWISACDCLLRLPGESNGADDEVKLAVKLGLPIFYSVEEAIDKCYADKSVKRFN